MELVVGWRGEGVGLEGSLQFLDSFGRVCNQLLGNVRAEPIIRSRGIQEVIIWWCQDGDRIR